jgi:hypothetical protein
MQDFRDISMNFVEFITDFETLIKVSLEVTNSGANVGRKSELKPINVAIIRFYMEIHI